MYIVIIRSASDPQEFIQDPESYEVSWQFLSYLKWPWKGISMIQAQPRDGLEREAVIWPAYIPFSICRCQLKSSLFNISTAYHINTSQLSNLYYLRNFKWVSYINPQWTYYIMCNWTHNQNINASNFLLI